MRAMGERECVSSGLSPASGDRPRLRREASTVSSAEPRSAERGSGKANRVFAL